MSIGSALAIYFVLWWIVLFAVLPFGVRSQHEDGDGIEGTDPGAPTMARMGQKVVVTTIVTTIVFGAAYWGYLAGYFNIERLTKAFGIPI